MKSGKLLLLGGSRYLLPVIEAAHRLGCTVITCDYRPDNIAHRYADEYVNISIVEKDAVLDMAREKGIAGVMSFACDPGVVTAAYVAERLGLPSCGPYESVCVLQNKAKFRRFLSEHGFRCPTAKGYASAKDALKDTAMFHWPVIVKPTDSAGSKGVSRIDRAEDLEKGIRNALRFSQSGTFIVEDFLEKEGHSSDTDSFSVEGELRYVSYSSQYFDVRCQNPYTPAAYAWPATLPAAQQDELTAETQRLLRLLGMRTSIYNIETRVCTDGKPYIMECSPRGGGNRLAEMLRYATGEDLIEASVLAALGKPVHIEQKPYRGCWGEVILHSRAAGVLKAVRISDAMADHVVERDLWVAPGERIEGFTGANHAIGTVVLHFDSPEALREVLDRQDEYISVEIDTGGGGITPNRETPTHCLFGRCAA